MREENYIRAGVIKDRLLQLEIHKGALCKSNFNSYPGGLTYQFNDHHPDIKLFSKNIPEKFFKDYMDSIEKEIQDLKEEFENL